MAVLNRLVLATMPLTACYAPELRDCAVSCTRQDDCAPGQVCGAEALCAAPAIAGRCATLTASDAGAGAAMDGPPSDGEAPVPPNDGPTSTLTVRISGRGHVVVLGTGWCDHTAPHQRCTFEVQRGIERTLTATPAVGMRFDRWSEACTGRSATCQVTPLALATSVHARFRDDDDDDDDDD